MKGKPRVGDFCAVYWLDACGHGKIKPRKAKLVPVVTLGVLNVLGRRGGVRVVTLSQSRFTFDDGCVQFQEVQVIPRSQVTRLEVLKRAGR